jgi:hypothetical protein
VGAVIVRHEASRILMPRLIPYGTLNCLYVPKTALAGSDDENSRFLFSNLENLIDKISPVDFASFWQEIEQD